MPHRGLSLRRPYVLCMTIVCGIIMLGMMGLATAQVPVDPALASYQPSRVSEGSHQYGSDDVEHPHDPLGGGVPRLYPNVTIQIEGKGTSSAPPALIASTAMRADEPRHEAFRRGCL